jgi:CPA2 family monovalent cation:H+ antiporter-2
VLFAAFAAVRAGYSTALGSFLLGAVIAGTRHKDEIERSFAPLQNIFGAIFFLAVGMMFDVRLLLQVWWLVAIVTLLTLIARPIACAFGLIAIGHSSRNSLKAGLALIPVGEFAFVMIQVGKSSNILPEIFYALAIGVSLATAVIGPLLTRRSEAICSWIEAREPRVLRETIQFYHRWLAEFHVRSNASLLWNSPANASSTSLFIFSSLPLSFFSPAPSSISPASFSSIMHSWVAYFTSFSGPRT